jgi:hypothetical protein
MTLKAPQARTVKAEVKLLLDNMIQQTGVSRCS